MNKKEVNGEQFSPQVSRWLKEKLKEQSGFWNGVEPIHYLDLRPIAHEAGVYTRKTRWIEMYYTLRPGVAWPQNGNIAELDKSDYRSAYSFGGGTGARIIHLFAGWLKKPDGSIYAALKKKYLQMIIVDEKAVLENGSGDLECPSVLISRRLEELGRIGREEIKLPGEIIFIPCTKTYAFLSDLLKGVKYNGSSQ